MKKALHILLVILLCSGQVFAADSKLSELTAETAPATTDILYIVTDPSGTPSSQQITAGNLGKAILIASTTVASLPTGETGLLRIVTDGTDATDCDTGGGSSIVICFYNGTSWSAAGSSGGAEADTLDTVIGRGNTTDGCTQADKCQFGNGTVYWDIYCDDTNVCYFETSEASTLRLRARTNQNIELYDEEGAAAILTIDPDAASTLAMYTFGTAYKPKKTIWFPAGALSVDATNCAAPSERTINSGPKMWTIRCTDAAGVIHGSIQMPDAWDGGTVTFTIVVTHGTTESIGTDGDVAMACRADSGSIDSTYGSAIALDVDVTTANDVEIATSAAVTPNGSCAGGDFIYWKWTKDAAGSDANSANTDIIGFKMEYSVTSLSD